jgi:tetratricopeptide (TPR) repeat protein
MQGRCAEWLEASERALVHYRRSGWSDSGCLSELAAALFYGPTPVSSAVERCLRALSETAERSGRAHVLVYLGGLHALAERFEEALEALDEGEAILRELGESYALANNSGRIRGRIYLLSGEPQRAEQTFRSCCATFEQARDEAALSTVASELALALCEQGRYPDAGQWAGVAREHAPSGDIAAQFSWRNAAARVRGATGGPEAALPLALEALDIVERTDALTDHGDVLVEVAELLRRANRQQEAFERIEAALALFARKENVASARRARAMLAELAVA